MLIWQFYFHIICKKKPKIYYQGEGAWSCHHYHSSPASNTPLSYNCRTDPLQSTNSRYIIILGGHWQTSHHIPTYRAHCSMCRLCVCGLVGWWMLCKRNIINVDGTCTLDVSTYTSNIKLLYNYVIAIDRFVVWRVVRHLCCNNVGSE